MHDLFGSPAALGTPEALPDWNALCRAFLAHGQSAPDHLARVIAAAPDAALPQAVRGIFCMLLARSEMIATAREALTAARAASIRDVRSDHLTAALSALLARQPERAVAEVEAILERDPGDTLAMKLSHGIRFLVGDAAGMRASVERVLPAHGVDHAGCGYALGCHAFALEETGDYAAAEAVGLAGLQHADDDAWGLHAVAHVHDMTGQTARGIALIESRAGVWAECNNFRHHIWWHRALLHLDRGEIDTVLWLYDTKIRAEHTDDYRDIANATSLLMRLELEGVPVGSRWEELAALAEARTEDGALVFADLHYMLALIGGDRAAAQDRLAAQLVAQASTSDGLAAAARHPGQAAVTGLMAFAAGQYAPAALHLGRALTALQSIGGSHAQRDVFQRMAVEAALRAGQTDRAEAILAARASWRGGYSDRFAETRLARIDDTRQLARAARAQ